MSHFQLLIYSYTCLEATQLYTVLCSLYRLCVSCNELSHVHGHGHGVYMDMDIHICIRYCTVSNTREPPAFHGATP
jgi:hypothetical protein